MAAVEVPEIIVGSNDLVASLNGLLSRIGPDLQDGVLRDSEIRGGDGICGRSTIANIWRKGE